MRALDFKQIRDFVYAVLKLPQDAKHLDRLIAHKTFRGTITSVRQVDKQYYCTLRRTGEAAADGMTYLCVTPGYAPGIGDDVLCAWIDEHAAIVWLPMKGAGAAGTGGTGSGPVTTLQAGPSGTPLSAAVEFDQGAQMLLTEAGQIITVAWNDPTSVIGDLIARTQLGLSRIPIGAVGTVLQVKNLGNFAQELLGMNPYLWYRLSEASGSVMGDSSQSGGHAGAFSGSGVTYHVSPATGDGDYAVTFNGSGYGHVGADPTGAGDFSIAFFVKGTDTTIGHVSAGTFDDGGGFGNPAPAFSWAFIPNYNTGSSGPTFYVAGTAHTNAGWLTAPGATVLDGNWHFVVITRALTSGAVTMYVDGVAQTLTNHQDASGGTIYPGTALNGGTDLYIGTANAGLLGWTGSQDEFALWQRLLTASEVATLQANVAGPAAAVPSWGPSPGIPIATGVAEGDIIYFHNGVWTRLGVGGANTVLHGGSDPGYAAVVEGDLSLSDIPTANVSMTKHGLAPKAPNDATKYLDGTGAYSVPAGSGVHVHAVGEQMTGNGSATVFYLANEAEQGGAQSSVAAYVSGSRSDVTLSADGAKITFASAPAAAAAIRVDYLAVLGA